MDQQTYRQRFDNKRHPSYATITRHLPSDRWLYSCRSTYYTNSECGILLCAYGQYDVHSHSLSIEKPHLFVNVGEALFRRVHLVQSLQESLQLLHSHCPRQLSRHLSQVGVLRASYRHRWTQLRPDIVVMSGNNYCKVTY